MCFRMRNARMSIIREALWALDYLFCGTFLGYLWSYHGGTVFLGTTQMVQQKTATRRIMWLHLDRVVKLKKEAGFLVPSPGCNTS